MGGVTSWSEGYLRDRRLYEGARSKTKCNIFGRKCCRGTIYTQLSREERTMIHTQLEMGLTPAAIAMGLNRSASTLSRELRRNGWTRPKTCRGPGRPPVAGSYRADAAHTRAQACAPSPRALRAACDPEPRCGSRSPAP
jgi:hypothetical protein